MRIKQIWIYTTVSFPRCQYIVHVHVHCSDVYQLSVFKAMQGPILVNLSEVWLTHETCTLYSHWRKKNWIELLLFFVMYSLKYSRRLVRFYIFTSEGTWSVLRMFWVFFWTLKPSRNLPDYGEWGSSHISPKCLHLSSEGRWRPLIGNNKIK